jgi:hypothetical protein
MEVFGRAIAMRNSYVFRNLSPNKGDLAAISLHRSINRFAFYKSTALPGIKNDTQRVSFLILG